MAEQSMNDYLDDDVLLIIFSNFTSISEIINIQRVCSRWERLCRGSWSEVNTLSYEYDGRCVVSKSGDGEYEVSSVDELVELLQCCGPNILHFKFDVLNVDLANFVSILTAVSEYCKNHEDINIRMPYRRSTFRFRTLLAGCSNLKTLHITNLTRDVERDLSLLQHEDIKLKRFSVSFARWGYITGKFLEYLPEDLEELIFNKCYDGQRAFSFSQLEKFKNLRSFESTLAPWYEASREPRVLGKMETLVKLTLVHTFFLQSSFDNLVSLVNLKELDLRYNYYLEDPNLINILNNCKQIEILKLTGCATLSDPPLVSICTSLEKLKWLEIDHIIGISDEPMARFPLTLEHLSCNKSMNVKVDGILDLMRRVRVSKLSIILDISSDAEALIAGCTQIIVEGSHHISLRIGPDVVSIIMTKKEPGTMTLLSIEPFQNSNVQYMT